MRTSAKFWAVSCLLIGVFLLFFSCKDLNEKNYTFHRKMLKQPLFKSNKDFILASNSHLIAANELICSYKFSQDTAMISYYDADNFNKLDSFQIINPHFRQISYFNSNHVFFIDKFILYDFSVHQRLTDRIPVNNFKIFSMVSLNSESNQFLLFGELKVPSGYRTGFYLLNTLTQKITSSKILETNKNSAAFENVLIYSGEFSINNDRVIYTCDKFSKIYFLIFTENSKRKSQHKTIHLNL